MRQTPDSAKLMEDGRVGVCNVSSALIPLFFPSHGEQTCHGEALSAGWPQDVDRFVGKFQ